MDEYPFFLLERVPYEVSDDPDFGLDFRCRFVRDVHVEVLEVARVEARILRGDQIDHHIDFPRLEQLEAFGGRVACLAHRR